jgi:hypothetical protein
MKKIRMTLTPNQEGKTTIGAYEAACYALGCHPHKHIRIPNTGWIVTAKALKEGVEKDFLPKFEEVVGSRDIQAIKNNAQGVPYKIIWRTGSVSYMMSAEQNDKVFEGSTIDWAWFDEPFRREIFVAVRRGLMKAGGHLWWTMTPLDEPWIYESLYEKGVEGHPDIDVFEGDPGENKHIKDEDRESFWSTLTEDELQSRKFGKFAHLSGRVIKSYNYMVHRVPSFDIPKHWPVWGCIDPHTRKPHAALFLACAPTEAFYVCNEVFIEDTIKEFGMIVRDIASQYRMVDFLIDTSAQEEGWDKQSAREILAGVGLHTRLAQKKNKYKSGIITLNQHFNDQKLFVMEHCRRTDRELRLHVYKKSRSSTGKVLEEPEDRMNDMIANLRYIFAERPDFSGPSQIKTREIPYKSSYERKRYINET